MMELSDYITKSLTLAFPERFSPRMTALYQHHVLQSLVEIQRRVPRCRQYHTTVLDSTDGTVVHGATVFPIQDGKIRRIEMKATAEGSCPSTTVKFVTEPHMERMRQLWCATGACETEGVPAVQYFSINESELTFFPAIPEDVEVTLYWDGIRRFAIPGDEEEELEWADLTVEASRMFVLYKAGECMDKKPVQFAQFAEEAGSLRWEDLRRMEPRYPQNDMAIAVAVYGGGSGASGGSSGGGVVGGGQALRLKNQTTQTEFDVYIIGDDEAPEIRLKKVEA